MGYFNKTRGYSLERRITRAFEAAGFSAKRNGFSATPDVIVYKRNTVILGLECKNRTQKDNKPIYISEKQMELLYSFCDTHGIKSYIAYSFYRKQPQIIEPEKLRKTKTGTFVIDETVKEASIGLSEFIAHLGNHYLA